MQKTQKKATNIGMYGTMGLMFATTISMILLIFWIAVVGMGFLL